MSFQEHDTLIYGIHEDFHTFDEVVSRVEKFDRTAIMWDTYRIANNQEHVKFKYSPKIGEEIDRDKIYDMIVKGVN